MADTLTLGLENLESRLNLSTVTTLHPTVPASANASPVQDVSARSRQALSLLTPGSNSQGFHRSRQLRQHLEQPPIRASTQAFFEIASATSSTTSTPTPTPHTDAHPDSDSNSNSNAHPDSDTSSPADPGTPPPRQLPPPRRPRPPPPSPSPSAFWAASNDS